MELVAGDVAKGISTVGGVGVCVAVCPTIEVDNVYGTAATQVAQAYVEMPRVAGSGVIGGAMLNLGSGAWVADGGANPGARLGRFGRALRKV